MTVLMSLIFLSSLALVILNGNFRSGSSCIFDLLLGDLSPGLVKGKAWSFGVEVLGRGLQEKELDRLGVRDFPDLGHIWVN